MLNTNRLEMFIGQRYRELTHVRHFMAGVSDPLQAQSRKLLQIIRNNEETAFGKRHNFDRINSIEQYQKLVPSCTYEDLYPYVENMKNGKKAQLTAQDPIMFASTSGTTDRPKFIPITRDHLRDYTHAFQVHNYQMAEDHPPGSWGQFLIITSNDEEGVTRAGIPYGAVSGLLNRQQSPIIKRHFALPYELSKIKDVDTKYYLMLRLALAQNVTTILCCNPSSLLLLADQMGEHAEKLVTDIYDGKVSSEYSIPAAFDKAFKPFLSAQRTLARRLARTLDQEGKLSPKNAWPNLALVSCWKGGPMSFYLDQLQEPYGNLPVRDFGYMASEGRGNIPLSDQGAGGVIAVTSHFFEFVPEAEMDSPDRHFLTVDQLEVNGRYYIHFTTAAGLYRYNISDLIEVVGFFKNTPVIQFIRKGAGISSITGEKLTEEQVRVALARAVAKLGITGITQFISTVQLDRPPYYVCFIELKEELSDSLRNNFLRAFDQALKAQNPEYRDKRDTLRLGTPRLKVLPTGTCTKIRQMRVLEGAPEAQVKIPLLVRVDDSVLDEVQHAVNM